MKDYPNNQNLMANKLTKKVNMLTKQVNMLTKQAKCGNQSMANGIKMYMGMNMQEQHMMEQCMQEQCTQEHYKQEQYKQDLCMMDKWVHYNKSQGCKLKLVGNYLSLDCKLCCCAKDRKSSLQKY